MSGSPNERKDLQDLYSKIFEKMAELDRLEKDHANDKIAWWETEERKIQSQLEKLEREIGTISRDMGPKKPGELQ
jgi:predicted ribosome quality control (RQC) complex YloA/Tae2 family protein